MAQGKKLITFFLPLFLFYTVSIFTIPHSKTKYYRKDFACLGVRYLNSLEFEVPESEIPSTKLKVAHPAYNPKKYISLIEKRYHAPVFIQYINTTVGYGVFAGKNFRKGDMIGEYTGIVRKIDETNTNNFGYSWGYLYPPKLIIDAKDAGNYTRFINHSSIPNIDVIYIQDCKKRWHMIYVANKPIKKGEQLLANYGTHYWSSRGVNPSDL